MKFLPSNTSQTTVDIEILGVNPAKNEHFSEAATVQRLMFKPTGRPKTFTCESTWNTVHALHKITAVALAQVCFLFCFIFLFQFEISRVAVSNFTVPWIQRFMEVNGYVNELTFDWPRDFESRDYLDDTFANAIIKSGCEKVKVGSLRCTQNFPQSIL